MDKILEFLPLMIPLLIAELALLGYSLYHILTHNTYKRGNRILWIILSFINFIGPILYIVFGREDS